MLNIHQELSKFYGLLSSSNIIPEHTGRIVLCSFLPVRLQLGLCPRCDGA